MNTPQNTKTPRRRRGRRWLGAAALALPLLGLAACDLDRLLDVDDPDTLLPEEIVDPLMLPAIRASALGDFTLAYAGAPIGGGGTEGIVLMGGLISDEFRHSGTFDTREVLDRRITIETNAHVQGLFHLLQRARVSAERSAGLFGELGPNQLGHAEAYNLAGYVYSMLAENYCSGIPFSELRPDGTMDHGEPETTVQVFNRAIARFQSAQQVAATGNLPQQHYLAQLGIARAQLGLGQYDAAAATAAGVPTDFEYLVWHSETSARQNNGIWAMNNNAGRWSVGNAEGINGLPFRAEGRIDGDVRDPRIPSMHIGAAQRTTLRPDEQWGQLKYPNRPSPTVLATGIEARLIEAEAALRAGQVDLFVELHNYLRANVPLEAQIGFELQALDEDDIEAMSQREREDLHFKERAYWLWLTGRRLPDLRRLIWDYGRQQDEIFPIGTHHRGSTYGSDTHVPVPFDERNNPLFDGCFTRDDHAGRHG